MTSAASQRDGLRTRPWSGCKSKVRRWSTRRGISPSAVRARMEVPWQIGVADPFHKGEEIVAIHLTGECGVATSGKDRRRWIRDGTLKHHIIDPLTDQPAETDLLTVTVIAPDVMRPKLQPKLCSSWAAASAWNGSKHVLSLPRYLFWITVS